MEELARVAHEASLRALDKQEDVVRELRSRTAVLPATASFAVSIAGGAAIRASAALGVAAVAAALTSSGASLYVLLPQPKLRFSIHGAAVLVAYGRSADASALISDLVHDLDRLWRANDSIVVRLLTVFRVAAGALMGEITLLAAALGGTL